MDGIPEDPHARQAWLARWAAEKATQSELAAEAQRSQTRQRDSSGSPHQIPATQTISAAQERPRLRVRVARMIERTAERLDLVFDRGLDTDDHFDYPERRTVDGFPYAPSLWHVLPRALRAVDASDRDVLVDFGCGKGRIVHQAARWPLKRVIGVELSPELAGFAQALVDSHRHKYRCRSVEIVVCDAARFQVPDDLTIGYFYEPFRGQTLDAVLRNLVESIDRRPRRVQLIYVGAGGGWQMLATGRFRPVRKFRVTLAYNAVIFESW